MTALDDIATKKLVQMKALLGDEASKKILEAAEAKEQAAQAAGLEFKEKKTTTKDADETETETEDETTEPLTLSALLAELEQGLAEGAIVDDVTQDENGATEADAKEADEAFKVALKEVVAQVFDEKFGKFLTAMSLKEAAADPKVAAAMAQIKKNEADNVKLKEQLDELLGVQPKAKPYRASQEAATTVKENDPLAQAAPHQDPVNSFISDFVLAPQNGNGKV